MSEIGEGSSKEITYPVTLDVVLFGGKEYQVKGSAQTGNPKKDIYNLRDPLNLNVLIEVKGARFELLKENRKPGSGEILHRDEGVMVTGKLVGGKLTKWNVPS